MTDRLSPNRYGTPPGPEEQLTTAERFALFIEDLGLQQTPAAPERLPAPEKPAETTQQERAKAFGDHIQAQLDESAAANPLTYYIDGRTGLPGRPVTD